MSQKDTPIAINDINSLKMVAKLPQSPYRHDVHAFQLLNLCISCANQVHAGYDVINSNSTVDLIKKVVAAVIHAVIAKSFLPSTGVCLI